MIEESEKVLKEIRAKKKGIEEYFKLREEREKRYKEQTKHINTKSK